MKESSRYLVGIDLGTTNSVVAYADLHESADERSSDIQVLEIPQLDQPGEVRATPTLPSFLYFPSEDELLTGAINLPWEERPASVAGTLARERGALAPGRQVSSAKSWLCQMGIDQTTKILPNDAEPGVAKVSPVEATSRYLMHLRNAWNHTIGVEGTSSERMFENQEIVLTVPASFNEEARELTVEAAQLAGLGNFTLLEEPVAAFYAWIAEHRAALQEKLQDGDLVLICDIGGGTSDFSLVRARVKDSEVQFERTAIGQHLLLGGDNLDLALAHSVEQKLHSTKLGLRQRHALRRVCCAAKERLLSEPDLERLPIHVLGGGRSVVGQMLSAELSRDEVIELLCSGFLPITTRDEMPLRERQSGLRELGLPYATDPAVTKHLAAFLTQAAVSMEVGVPTSSAPASRDSHARLARPDAILFNGGFCAPDITRDRITDAVVSWFDAEDSGWRPKLLINEAMDFAVAKGAAYYGMVRRGAGLRIKAGSARSYYIGTRSEEGLRGVCVLPSGTDEGTTLSLDHGFSVLANRPVSFTLYSSTIRHDRHGEIAVLDQEQVYRHAPLVTVLRYGRKLRDVELAVRLTVSFTEVGTLELWCESVNSPHRWRLQFAVRSGEAQSQQGNETGVQHARPSPPLEASMISDRTLESAERLIRSAFGKSNGEAGVQVSPVTIINELVAALGMERESWSLATVRRFCDVLLDVADGRKISPTHEVRWLNLFGYCLRPGFGEPQDKARIDQARKVYQAGLAFPRDLQCQVEWLVLWRRVSAGLSATHQHELQNYLSGLGIGRKFKGGRLNSQVEREGWRLLASLEHLSVSTRSSLGYELLRKINKEPANSDLLWALSRLGARIPFYGSLNSVVPAETAADWIQTLIELREFSSDAASGIVQLCLRTGDRARDVSDDVRQAAINRITAAGLQDKAALQRLENYVVPDHRDVVRIFGESLPKGLRLESTVNSLSPVTALS